MKFLYSNILWIITFSVTFQDECKASPFIQRLSLNYLGIYYGASLADPIQSKQPTVQGNPDPANPLSLENLITAGYRLNNETTVGAVGHFNYFPVGNPTGSGHSLQLLDPLFMLNRADLYKNGGFSIAGRLNVQIPLSSNDFLAPNHIVTAITPTIFLNYIFPKVPLTLGATGYIRGYIPDPHSPADCRTNKFYLATNASYKLSKKVSATLWIDFVNASRNRGTAFFAGTVNAPMDIEPGINWNITDSISINPILNIYPSNPTLASTSFRAIISARAL